MGKHEIVAQPKVGQQIGAYTVIRPLGKGAAGAVYEVEHTLLGGRFALKAFAPGEANAERLKSKFLAEGKILAALDHPNVVKVRELAVDPASGMPYFVMDLVLYKDGEPHTLDDVEISELDESFVRVWFEDLCAALDYVHARKIVHRDIKCGNILLRADRHVMLSDFGISRVLGETMARQLKVSRTLAGRTVTQTSFVMGTSGYMAPEVVRGRPATPAADVYSLGVLFFRLLTGIWYEAGSSVLEMLDLYDLRWNRVLPWMLAVDPKKRPYKLAGLPRLLPREKGSAS